MTTTKNFGKPPMAGILQQKVFGLPVDRENMFSNHKGVYKPRIEKRQQKLMAKISFIRHFLEPDETILLVTKGHSPLTVLEKVGIGWLFLYLKRSLLVFTDRRIFHVPTTPRYGYRNSIAQIRYEFCKSIEIKRTSLVVQYKEEENRRNFSTFPAGREKRSKSCSRAYRLKAPRPMPPAGSTFVPSAPAPCITGSPAARDAGCCSRPAPLPPCWRSCCPGAATFTCGSRFWAP